MLSCNVFLLLLPPSSSPRYCQYTERFFCLSCHSGMKAVLPTRVLHQWDVRPHKVCDEAKAYLDRIYSQPLLCVSAINPLLFESVRSLRHVRLLRLQLGEQRAESREQRAESSDGSRYSF